MTLHETMIDMGDRAVAAARAGDVDLVRVGG